MIAVVRMLGFVATALVTELLRGTGLAAVAFAALIGAARWHPLLLVVVIVAGTAASLIAPETDISSGKVSHSLSNAPFVGLLYLLLAAFGYACGRLYRFARRP